MILQGQMMEVVACYNVKGGVGKTTTAVNLAYHAAAQGYRTLLWDLDPQGAASWYLRAEPSVTPSAKKVVNGKTPVGSLVTNSLHANLDVLPSTLSYRNLDLLLRKADSPQALAELIKPLGETYSLVVLDCPPSLSKLADNVFAAADLILVPLVPSTLSVRAFEQLHDYFKREKLSGKKLLPFFAMVDRRRKLHKAWLETPPLALPRLLTTSISLSTQVERMNMEQAPIAHLAASGALARAYGALWDEIQPRLTL